jgi:hypothetical protein
MSRRAAAIAAALLLALEVAIALFVTGGFARHTLGDVLAALLVAFALYAFGLNARAAAAGAFLIAACVEFAQALDLADRLRLAAGSPARIALGATFDGRDLLAYLAGAGAFPVIARLVERRAAPSSTAARR